MKTRSYALFFCVLLYGSNNLTHCAIAQDSIGTIAAISGRALLKRGADSDVDAKVNMPLLNADLIRTDAAGSVKILLTDQSILDVGPNSSFRLDSFDATQSKPSIFSLFYGKVRALVTHAPDNSEKMKFRTSTAIMGVRGTELIIAAPNNGATTQTQVTVVTGAVSMTLPRAPGTDVNPQARVILNPGQQAVATMGAQSIAAPVTLSATQLQAQVSQGRVSDNTFDRTVSIDNNPQSGDAPKGSNAKSLATDQMVQEGASLRSQGDAPSTTDDSRSVNMSALKLPTDAPAQVITGLLKTVKVSLSR